MDLVDFLTWVVEPKGMVELFGGLVSSGMGGLVSGILGGVVAKLCNEGDESGNTSAFGCGKIKSGKGSGR